MAKFMKGQSGNPGGRPPDHALKDFARGQTEQAVKTLVAVMNSKKAPAASRVSAACALLDRGYGKPTQRSELAGKDGDGLLPEVDVSVIAREVAFLLRMGAEAEDAEIAGGDVNLSNGLISAPKPSCMAVLPRPGRSRGPLGG